MLHSVMRTPASCDIHILDRAPRDPRSSAHGLAQKQYNWSTLNQRVFRRLGFVVAASECEAVALCEAGAVERVLKLLRTRITDHAERQRQSARAGASAEPLLQQSRDVRLTTALVWPCAFCTGSGSASTRLLHDSGKHRGAYRLTQKHNAQSCESS